jgi:hypothetical protein
VIDSGMVSLADVRAGRVTLADIAEASHYLDMKQDIERYFTDKSREEGKHGWRSGKRAYH